MAQPESPKKTFTALPKMPGFEMTAIAREGNPEAIGSPADAKTIYVDGLKGIELKKGVVKLYFVEHITAESSELLSNRFVVNLAMGQNVVDQLIGVLSSLDISAGTVKVV